MQRGIALCVYQFLQKNFRFCCVYQILLKFRQKVQQGLALRIYQILLHIYKILLNFFSRKCSKAFPIAFSVYPLLLKFSSKHVCLKMCTMLMVSSNFACKCVPSGYLPCDFVKFCLKVAFSK